MNYHIFRYDIDILRVLCHMAEGRMGSYHDNLASKATTNKSSLHTTVEGHVRLYIKSVQKDRNNVSMKQYCIAIKISPHNCICGLCKFAILAYKFVHLKVHYEGER